MASLSRKPAFTLVELLVSIALISILGAITASFIISSMRDHERAQATSEVQGEMAMAVNRVGKALRGTTQIINAAPIDLTIRGYANVTDTAPSQLRYFLDSNAWKFGVIPPSGTPPNYSYDPANEVIHLLVGKVTNSDNQPIFQYYDGQNNLLTTPIEISSVRLIEVSPVGRDIRGWMVSPTSLTTRVNLRNLKTNL